MSERLASIRGQIDAIDEQLLQLFNDRARLAIKVGEVKRAGGSDAQFYRPDRESQVLRRILSLNAGPLSDENVARLIREVMSACLALESRLRVAYLGPEGTYTQLAAEKHFGQFVELRPLAAIDVVFRDVAAGASDFGVVPIENSAEGVITYTLDTLARSTLQICGEVELAVHHHLLTRAAALSDIRTVLAHPQALAQCRRWLDEHMSSVERVNVASNAEAARRSAEDGTLAAIAGSAAAELYALTVIANNIEDEPDNTTRFLILGKRMPVASGADKSSLMFATANRPGALHQVLAAFEQHGINMTRIESRPSRQGKWAYSFFVDVDGHADTEPLATALRQVAGMTNSYRLLGSYPKSVV
jgi:chorismate mutase/prephenate dehydratase